MRKSICILAFSHIARDARVLRQIRYLLPVYDLIVIGYGPPHPAYHDAPNIRWIQLDQVQPEMPNLLTAIQNHEIRDIKLPARIARKLRQLTNILLSWTGIFIPSMKEAWYWRQKHYAGAWQEAVKVRCHAYHANDWDTLPIAAEAARRNGAKLILDLHEYAPLEYEELPHWWIKKRFITYLLKKYSPIADASLTVAAPIAERYRSEFGFSPMVLMNVSEKVSVPSHGVNEKSIRLIHHGGASRLRNPELMIQTIKQCDERYSLHFMFLQNDYVEELKCLAETLAPGRVFFHDPVPPEAIVHRISEFDAGFYILPPTNFNNLVALPNKFLDFISAGLAVCIGPSPAMAEIVKRFDLGIVSPTFNPKEAAELLNRTSTGQWETMREKSRTAALELNAQMEMEKLVKLYARII